MRCSKYNKFGRTYLFDLDFHHLKEGKETWELKYTVDAYHAGNVSTVHRPNTKYHTDLMVI